MQANTSPKPLILIDGSSYLYRAFHALPPLTNSRGEPTGAVYGVLNMIKKLLTDYDPEYVAVVFDAKGKTFRDEIYPAYKAHRPPMPDPLRLQIEPLREAIQFMGLPLISIEGIEADDVIGTLTRQALEQNWTVLISTGDKDMAQLVNDRVTLINTMSGTLLDSKGVQEKFGVPPESIIDYLALIGDTSDNIPGVPKVGPKTAAKWLHDYGSLDALIAQADKISGKIGENLRQSLEQLPLAKKLVTLRLYESLPVSVTELKPSQPDRVKLLELFRRLEFKNWLKELLEQESPAEKTALDYQLVLTQADLSQWINRIKQSKQFAFDIETTSLNTLDAQIVGFSFAVNANQAAYVPVAHDYIGVEAQLSLDEVLAQLKPVLENPLHTLIGQNLKYDIGVLANYGIEIGAKIYDTMLESYLLESSANRHDLDSLSLKYLGKKPISFESLAGKGANQLTFNQIALTDASNYAAEDADFALQLHQILWPKIIANDDLRCVLEDIEMPLVSVLSRMERCGVCIDPKLLAEQSQDLEQRIKTLEKEAYALADTMFNLASPKQLQSVLYEKMQLPILSKTPGGAPSTAESVLAELALDYPLPKLILEHRSLCKLKSTYTDSLPKQIHPKTGRVHTSYNQAVTATGRLSSTDPNLQNIPIRHEEGRRVRQAFIAPKGYKIISADYSQIELRIMAHLSHDPGLLKAFAASFDIHTATAAEVFGLPLTQVTQEQRRSAKAINFGLIYGMSAFGLSRQLGVSREVAQAYVDKYFARYPGVKFYMEAIRALARKQGYVETLLGRRLSIPEINSSQMQRRRAAERAAINAPMQGTAADIIKIAMISLDAWIRQSGVDVKMIMQVHDELVFEVAEDCVDLAKQQIEAHMIHAVKLEIPLVVNINVGNNWDEAH
ncbi:MAG TPA: DNA polymerase I [Gammaproteobacteria bacterium]|nr:DNA polymerase I [Gammaproteobacteria bacterium]